MEENKYIIKTAIPDEINKNSLALLGVGAVILLFSLPLLIFNLGVLFKDPVSGIVGLVISSFFTFIGSVMIFGGLVTKYGITQLVLNGELPVSKYVKIRNFTLITKEYHSLKSVQPQNNFPELNYPPSILISRDSEPSIKFKNRKSGINLIKTVKNIINSNYDYKNSNNYNDILLIAILNLWEKMAVHLIIFKIDQKFLGIRIGNNKERYMFIQGPELEQIYKSSLTGTIEKSILAVLNNNNQNFGYEDNDLNQISKKIIKTHCSYPERLFPDMARNQGVSMGLITKVEQEYNIKTYYKETFEKSKRQLEEYIINFNHNYPELFKKFRDDINTGVRSMDNTSD